MKKKGKGGEGPKERKVEKEVVEFFFFFLDFFEGRLFPSGGDYFFEKIIVLRAWTRGIRRA